MQVYLWFQLWIGGGTPESYKANWPAPGSISTTDQSTNLTNTWRQIQLHCIATHSDQSANCMDKDSSPKEHTKAGAALLSHLLRTENISKQDQTSGFFSSIVLLFHIREGVATSLTWLIHFHKLGMNAHTHTFFFVYPCLEWGFSFQCVSINLIFLSCCGYYCDIVRSQTIQYYSFRNQVTDYYFSWLKILLHYKRGYLMRLIN